jgi:hypothetical protein
VLGDIEYVARQITASVWGKCRMGSHCKCWEENGEHYCKALHGKTLFTALYGTYKIPLDELKALL